MTGFWIFWAMRAAGWWSPAPQVINSASSISLESAITTNRSRTLLLLLYKRPPRLLRRRLFLWRINHQIHCGVWFVCQIPGLKSVRLEEPARLVQYMVGVTMAFWGRLYLLGGTTWHVLDFELLYVIWSVFGPFAPSFFGQFGLFANTDWPNCVDFTSPSVA